MIYLKNKIDKIIKVKKDNICFDVTDRNMNTGTHIDLLRKNLLSL